MISKNLRNKTRPLLINISDWCKCKDAYCYKNGYNEYLYKKYSIADNYKIFVKQGYVTKDNNISKIAMLTQRDKLVKVMASIYKLIYDEIKYGISKMHKIIYSANQDIQILEIQTHSYFMDSLLLQTEIEDIAEKMYSDLSYYIYMITENAYVKVYYILSTALENTLGNLQETTTDNEDLVKKELYDTINVWLKNFKKWLFDGINYLFDDSYLETKGYIEKDFSDNSFDNLKIFFEKSKDKIDKIIENTLSVMQTVVSKTLFELKQIKKYEIVVLEDEKTCEVCHEMSGKVFDISELKIGVTAPPFHPFCRCIIIPYMENENVDNENNPSQMRWDSWRNYKKVIVNGHIYAKVGNRLYSKHAVDRMQPSGKRYTVGDAIKQENNVEGRSIAPQFVEEVINSVPPIVQESGNLSYTSGSVTVITNPQGAVVTVITK